MSRHHDPTDFEYRRAAEQVINSPEIDIESPEFGAYLFAIMQPHTIRVKKNLMPPRTPETDTAALIAACDRADMITELRNKLDVTEDRTPKKIPVNQFQRNWKLSAIKGK